MSLRLRVVTCFCILSVLVSLIILSGRVSKLSHDIEYNSYTSGVATTNGVYFGENWNGKGWVYNMDFDGKVKDIMSSPEVYENCLSNLIVYGGKVYGLFYTIIYEEDDMGVVYNIVEMDTKLNPLRQIDDILIPAEEISTGFSADVDSLYLTTIKDDGANVYELPMDDFKDVKFTPVLDGVRSEKKLADMEEPENILYRSVDNGTTIVDALYADGVLNIKTDRDPQSSVYLPDQRVKDAVDKIHFSFGQQMELYGNYIAYWLGGLIIWFILLFLVFFLINRKNRVVYMFLVWEFTILIVLAASFYFIQTKYEDAAQSETTRFAILSLQGELDVLGNLKDVQFDDKDFYNSPQYSTMYDSLKHFVDRDGNSLIFNDVSLVRLKDRKVLIDAWGNNAITLDWYFGDTAGMVPEKLKTSPHGYYATNVKIDDAPRLVVGVTEDDLAQHDYALVGILSGDDPFIGVWADFGKLMIFFLVLFVVSSVLIGVILYFQNADLRHFEQEIREVALGKTKVIVPHDSATDTQSMWNSLSEIGKRIESVNYERFRIFEAYYRFAPKDIETIMAKDSIFDVKNGDVTTGDGTLMLVCTEGSDYGKRRIKALSNVVSFMDNYVGDREGILVSHDSNLSLLQFLFLKGANDTVSKAVQFMHRNDTDLESGTVSIFLYVTSFMYGVAGINDKCLTFLTSKYAKDMEAYAEWFMKRNVPLVITAWVKDQENPEPLRFIGYIKIDEDDERIDLYEALDACPARERQLKLSLKDKFEETLELFYNKDFYLARNSFTEILKECPEDEITRWYLFESERLLNEGTDDPEFGRIKI